MLISYPYTLTPEDGGFFVQFVDFSSGFTAASTEEEAAIFAGEVLDCLVGTYKDMGKTLPKASPANGNPVSKINI